MPFGYFLRCYSSSIRMPATATATIPITGIMQPQQPLRRGGGL